MLTSGGYKWDQSAEVCSMSDSYVVLCTYILMVTLSIAIRYAWSVFIFVHLSTLYSEEVLSPPAIVPHLPPYSILNQQNRYCRIMKTLWLVKILLYKESWSFIKYMPHRNVLQMKVIHLNEICVHVMYQTLLAFMILHYEEQCIVWCHTE